MMHRSAFRLSCALLAALVVGCGDDGPSGNDDPGLVIAPAFRGVPETDTLRLTATFNGEPIAVTWETQDATIATVSATGLVTGLKPGFVAITARASNQELRSASITVLPVPVLTSGTAVTISGTGARGTAAYRKIVVPAGATNLSVTISGGSGDVDMAVRRGAVPTLSSNDCVSEEAGNAETCTIANPAAGTWFILLYLWNPYAGASLRATVTP
ncbi:MAG: pre-peptidase C-terminal domain-containing protein [Cytophagaceae bacterium]|nr:pre-peptidase C-terminal domain-containing protein [Gemmatimonadaceae bacterium]